MQICAFGGQRLRNSARRPFLKNPQFQRAETHVALPRLLSSVAPMSQKIGTDVLIVGGGPVGLTLAMDLAQRGVDVTLVEMRSAGEPPKVSCNHVSARTMETFRRLGIASVVRTAGLPADYPNDVAF